MTGNERRKAARAPLDVPGALRVGDRWLTCTLKDISATGVALRTGLKYADGTAVTVVFMLPGSSMSIELDGVLVRRRGIESQKEWAIQYFPPSEEAAREVDGYIERKTGVALPKGRTRAQQRALEEALERRRLAAAIRAKKEGAKEPKAQSEDSAKMDDLFRNALDDLGKL